MRRREGRGAALFLLVAWAAAACRTGHERALPEPLPSAAPEAREPSPPASAAAPVSSAAVPQGTAADGGAAPCPAGARQVSVVNREGNLYLCGADGTQRQLTTGGNDSEVALSPDGKRGVFQRDAGKQQISLGGSGSVEIADNRVMLVELDGGRITEIARNDQRAGCLSLSWPRFAGADAVILQANGYEEATQGNESVCVVDIPSRTLHVIARRTRCTIFITAGRYRGSFYVSSAETSPSGRRELTQLVDRYGKVVHRLSYNPFIKDWNGDGMVSGDEVMPECLDPPPPQAALEAIMKQL
jgi:hypothetical protein